MRTEDIKGTGRDKLQEYGKEGLAPLMELFNRYGKDIIKYIKHVEEGLDQGCKSLRSHSGATGGEADKTQSDKEMVASWFEEGARWVGKLERQLETKNTDELLDFVESQGREHPAALFATSLIAGSVFGVVGKQAWKSRPESEEQASTQNFQSPDTSSQL